MIIDRGERGIVQLSVARAYRFTYRGEEYQARYNNGMWCVGVLTGSRGLVFEPMVTRHDLGAAVRAALDDVDQIDELMRGEWS